MKLNINQLAPHLTKNLAPIYVISGDETLLIDEALDSIRHAANQKGFSERIRINVESATEWGKNLYSCAQSLSLFSTKQLLELDLSIIKLNAASSKTLQEYIDNPPIDTVLLIRSQKFDGKTEQSNWYKSMDKTSVFIPIWPITIEQLPNWILQRAKKLNLNMTKPAADLLALLVEGNLLAASQELEKLRLLEPNADIDNQLIESIVMDNAQFDIFSLVDSVLAGNHKRCFRILNNLAADGSEPTLILWALTRELRTMAEIAKQVKNGTPYTTLFAKYRIWEKRQANVRAFLQRHSQETCWELLAKTSDIDQVIKGAKPGNIWDELGQFLQCFLIKNPKLATGHRES